MFITFLINQFGNYVVVLGAIWLAYFHIATGFKEKALICDFTTSSVWIIVGVVALYQGRFGLVHEIWASASENASHGEKFSKLDFRHKTVLWVL